MFSSLCHHYCCDFIYSSENIALNWISISSTHQDSYYITTSSSSSTSTSTKMNSIEIFIVIILSCVIVLSMSFNPSKIGIHIKQSRSPIHSSSLVKKYQVGSVRQNSHRLYNFKNFDEMLEQISEPILVGISYSSISFDSLLILINLL